MFVRVTTLAVLTVIVSSSAAADAQRRPTLPPAVAQLYQNPPVIELVTMGVGSLIWERHGHIALCVRYGTPRADRCYNYGIGDFHRPLSMGWGFFRGANSFWVGEMSPDAMLDTYRQADRTIWVQPLPLTDAQEQAVIRTLEHDARPENRAYSYDHFWDNCTTRVRDVLNAATDGALAALVGPTDGRTYRDLARQGFYGMRIPLLITDVAMGRVTDRVPTYWERMFLPDYMREAATRLWGIEPIVLYQRRGPPPRDHGPSGRGWLTLLILVMTAPAWGSRLARRFERTGRAIALVPPAVLGLVLWALAIISPLPYVRWNESCLVFVPFDLVVLFVAAPAARRYARARVIMLGAVLALLLAGVLVQPIEPEVLWPLIPLAITGWWPVRPSSARGAAA